MSTWKTRRNSVDMAKKYLPVSYVSSKAESLQNKVLIIIYTIFVIVIT